MNDLPPELLRQIIENLPQADNGTLISRDGETWRAQLAQYSTISPAWTACIESLVFRTLAISTDELNAFAALFADRNVARRAHLTSLEITFILPDPQNPMGCCAVTRTLDRGADSAAFSAAVSKLFTILADVDARSCCWRTPLALVFSHGRRHSRAIEPNGSTEVPCQPPRWDDYQHKRRDVNEAIAMSGQFKLRRDVALPRVHGVTTLDFRGFSDLDALKHTWISTVVGKLPDLEHLLLTGQDSYADGRDKRHEQRTCLSTALCSIVGDNLCKVRLDFRHLPMKNEAMPVHKFVEGNQWSQEPWYKVLSHLASFPCLAVLQLLGGLVVCPEFFRGITDHADTPFPALVEFELQFAMETADGRWFYACDDDAIETSRSNPKYEEWWREKTEDDAEWQEDRDYRSDTSFSEDDARVFEAGPFRTDVVKRDRFRTLPDTITFQPFLLDAARAVTRMPRLRKFVLKQGHQFTAFSEDLTYFPIVTRVFELWFLGVGMPRAPDDAPTHYYLSVPGDKQYLNQNRLYWRVGGWEPWDEVQDAWNGIAGPDAKILFMREENWKIVNGWRDHRVYEGEF